MGMFMALCFMAVPVAVPEQCGKNTQGLMPVVVVSFAVPVPVCMLHGGVRMLVSVAFPKKENIGKRHH